jgi:hypothetical protein
MFCNIVLQTCRLKACVLVKDFWGQTSGPNVARTWSLNADIVGLPVTPGEKVPTNPSLLIVLAGANGGVPCALLL